MQSWGLEVKHTIKPQLFAAVAIPLLLSSPSFQPRSKVNFAQTCTEPAGKEKNLRILRIQSWLPRLILASTRTW